MYVDGSESTKVWGEVSFNGIPYQLTRETPLRNFLCEHVLSDQALEPADVRLHITTSGIEVIPRSQ